MVSGVTAEKEWKNTLSLVAEHLRKAFQSSHPFKDDGEVSPSIVALRDAFHTFPVSADVLLKPDRTPQASQILASPAAHAC